MSLTSVLPPIAKGIVRGFDSLQLRGAPALFRLLGRLPGLSSAVGSARLGRSQVIRFPAFDAYWARYLWSDQVYEPDVDMIFRKLAPADDKLLIDCGANIGFWTVKLSDPAYRFTDFIAVEANPAMIPLLRENLEANAIAGQIVHAAVAETSGETVHLGGTADHASAKVGDTGIKVETVNLEALISKARHRDRLVVVKLDVEGSEVPAFRGATGVDDADLVFIYEDWPRSGMLATVHLLDSGYVVVGVAPTGEVWPISSLEEALRFNRATKPIYGPSNLIGCRQRAYDRIAPLLLQGGIDVGR